MSIKRINEFPDGSGSLSNDDVFIFMDNPNGNGVTKKISLSQISEAIGAGNPFDQDLNTTDFPTFSGVSLSNGTTLAQGTFDNSTGGNNGISLNCYVGYELNWQGGHLKCTQDGGATSANITLDSALQFSDNVVVCSTADNLALKYAAAKLLTPGGSSLSSTNRATLILMPGVYGISEDLMIDTEFVDILGLGSIKLDRGCKTAVSIIAPGTFTINVTANDVRVKGISVGTKQFKIGNNLPLQVIEDCSGGNLSFGGSGTASGTFTNCTGDAYSFGGSGTASGTFTNCTGGLYSFGGYSTASGSFTNCAATSSGFGGFGGIASGSFKDCASGGIGSFGGSGTASGTFTNCTGGLYSFGGGASGTASGTFTNCNGGQHSFGGLGGTASGKFLRCILTTGTFATLSGTGKYRLCIDGNYDVINDDAPTP